MAGKAWFADLAPTGTVCADASALEGKVVGVRWLERTTVVVRLPSPTGYDRAERGVAFTRSTDASACPPWPQDPTWPDVPHKDGCLGGDLNDSSIALFGSMVGQTEVRPSDPRRLL